MIGKDEPLLRYARYKYMTNSTFIYIIICIYSLCVYVIFQTTNKQSIRRYINNNNDNTIISNAKLVLNYLITGYAHNIYPNYNAHKIEILRIERIHIHCLLIDLLLLKHYIYIGLQ